ncbi:MAG: Hsp70 family protein [Planctomycetes bacterium]|nr:Hsp70 family protein [Planctomycetota bacterium]MBL7037370.1 Hsp70 family protein [Pirellulaceae bacterium]
MADLPVGIDLGTTFSVVAHLDNEGRPWTVQNAEGDLITPSAVFFDASGPIVGKEAVKAVEFEPDRVARFAKRNMGNKAFEKPICGNTLPPEVIQALILKKLKDDAELKLGPFSKAVITVPAYFNEPRRKATQDAGRLAGLEVLDIINEPTAAAIAFGVQQGFLTPKGESRQKETILVYDLGGGTFDVTLMEIDGQQYSAVATAGDVYLGGIEWDMRIADFVAEKFKDEFGVDLREDERALQTLISEAEDAKHALSARPEVNILFAHDGNRLRVLLSRDDFESMTGDLLGRTEMTAKRVLKEAGRDWNDLTRLLLVGGSTRMPMIRQMLEGESGLAADRSLSADEAVAHGAAIYASLLMANENMPRKGMSVTNVNSHDLGVLGLEPGTGMRRRKVLIPRNTPLPAVGTGTFVTQKVGQASVKVTVVEGGDATGEGATDIGKCVVSELPPDQPAKTPVKVAFNYSANGRLTVGASLSGTGRHANTTIQRSSGLTDDMLDQWKQRIESGELLEKEVSGVTESVGRQRDAVELPDAGQSVEQPDIEELDFDLLDKDSQYRSVRPDDPELGGFFKRLSD